MKKTTHWFIIGTFVSLYLMVSIISTIHVIDFFRLSNPTWLAITLAIAFEIGAAASLASIIVMEKMNKTLVWLLFITITLMQMQGNMYYAFVNLKDFSAWSELFALIEEDEIFQKRVLAAVSGAILPLVALGFIKSLVDYIKPEKNQIERSQVEEKPEPKPELEPELEPERKISNEIEPGIEEDPFEDNPFADEESLLLVDEEPSNAELLVDVSPEPIEQPEEEKKKVD